MRLSGFYKLIFAGLLILVYFLNVYVFAFLSLVALFTLYFFRDPRRNINEDPKMILSPADGKIVGLEHGIFIEEEKFTKISIFLSLFDVHVIRSPINGVIRNLKYTRGRFLNALDNRSSLANENINMEVENDKNQVRIKMIAGSLARKIICYKKEGESVGMGDKLGRIVLGSRVEISIPAESIAYMKVKEGGRVFAGITELCCLNL